MTEQLKKLTSNGTGKLLIEILRWLAIPVLTFIFIYYGAFVKLETRFDMFCSSFHEFKQDVKKHMDDKSIHFERDDYTRR